MFNRKFLLFAGLTLLALIAVGALIWFVGPRLGWGPLAFAREMHPGEMHHRMWFDMRPGLHSFGRMSFGWGGLLGLGLLRLVGWLLQLGLIVAIVMWLLRRNAPPAPVTQPIASVPPSEPPVNPPHA